MAKNGKSLWDRLVDVGQLFLGVAGLAVAVLTLLAAANIVNVSVTVNLAGSTQQLTIANPSNTRTVTVVNNVTTTSTVSPATVTVTTAPSTQTVTSAVTQIQTVSASTAPPNMVVPVTHNSTLGLWIADVGNYSRISIFVPSNAVVLGNGRIEFSMSPSGPFYEAFGCYTASTTAECKIAGPNTLISLPVQGRYVGIPIGLSNPPPLPVVYASR